MEQKLSAKLLLLKQYCQNFVKKILQIKVKKLPKYEIINKKNGNLITWSYEKEKSINDLIKDIEISLSKEGVESVYVKKSFDYVTLEDLIYKNKN